MAIKTHKFEVSFFRVGKSGQKVKTELLGVVHCEQRTAKQVADLAESVQAEYAKSCDERQMILHSLKRIKA